MGKPENFSGFATFPDRRSRAAFLRAVSATAPDLRRHATLAEGRPVIVFEGLNAAQVAMVRAALQGCGGWSGDVRFQPAG